jgi:hypothetical protein
MMAGRGSVNLNPTGVFQNDTVAPASPGCGHTASGEIGKGQTETVALTFYKLAAVTTIDPIWSTHSRNLRLGRTGGMKMQAAFVLASGPENEGRIE